MHISWNKKYKSERYRMILLGGNGLTEYFTGLILYSFQINKKKHVKTTSKLKSRTPNQMEQRRKHENIRTLKFTFKVYALNCQTLFGCTDF